MIKFSYATMQPIYPLLVQQFLDDYKLCDGVAVDIGTGPGHIGLELAKTTNMKIYFTDISEDALNTAAQNFKNLAADNEAYFICADVESLPFEDSFADFVVSRGSVGFWENPEKGLAQIHRILKPNGVAYIGVGCGRYIPSTMRERIYSAMWNSKDNQNDRPIRYTLDQFENYVKMAGIDQYKMVSEGDDRIGNWVEIRK